MKPVAWGIEITGELADVGLHKQQMELEFHRRQGKYPDPTRKFVELYTADQLREVEQQRDELLAALECAESLFDRKWNGVVGSGCEFNWHPVGNWRHYTCKMTGETFREAVAKVKP